MNLSFPQSKHLFIHQNPYNFHQMFCFLLLLAQIFHGSFLFYSLDRNHLLKLIHTFLKPTCMDYFERLLKTHLLMMLFGGHRINFILKIPIIVLSRLLLYFIRYLFIFSLIFGFIFGKFYRFCLTMLI